MTAPTLNARVMPPALFGGLKAHRVLERNLMVGRRNWMLLLSGFFEPVFYLFSIGVGVGQLVGDLVIVGYDVHNTPGYRAGLRAFAVTANSSTALCSVFRSWTRIASVSSTVTAA